MDVVELFEVTDDVAFELAEFDGMVVALDVVVSENIGVGDCIRYISSTTAIIAIANIRISFI